MQSGDGSVSTATNQPQRTSVFVSRIGDNRRHSAAPFSLTAILPTVESPSFGEHDASESHVNITRFQLTRDETLFHKMGRKLTSLLPGHDRNGTTFSLRIPMQTEVQVVQEGSYDARTSNSKEYWRKLPPIEYSREVKGSAIYGNPPSLAFGSTTSSLAERRFKRKPTPIMIPDSSDAVNTYVEQVYPNGDICQANKYSSHTSSRLRSHSIPSANSAQSLPTSSPLRHSTPYELASRSIKLPPPVPPRSPKRSAPQQQQQQTTAAMNVSNRATKMSHARSQSLSTMVKALFGVGTNGKLQSKKAAVLVSRTSSLKRMKSKASLSNSPTRAKFKAHYTVVKTHKSQTNPTQVNDSATAQMHTRKRREKLQSFLVMSPGP